jgi:hypothetical protein
LLEVAAWTFENHRKSHLVMNEARCEVQSIRVRDSHQTSPLHDVEKTHQVA